MSNDVLKIRGKRITHLISNNGFCRTDPATPGLLNICKQKIVFVGSNLYVPKCETQLLKNKTKSSKIFLIPNYCFKKKMVPSPYRRE